MTAGRLRVLTVLGTRPEIIKLAPVIPLLDEDARIEQVLLHTGQHYSPEMDAIFFRELALRPPDVALNTGSMGHGKQTAAIMCGVERTLDAAPFDGVLVLGDTNSTLGGALAAAATGVPVVHLEAGCRAFVRDMPEEINRVLVDHMAAHLLAPNTSARQNLLAEGIPAERIAVVGSTAIDAARLYVERARGRDIVDRVLSCLGEPDGSRVLLCTFHRAENTTEEVLPGILRGLGRIAGRYPIVLPLHPRTRRMMEQLGLHAPGRVHLLPPLGYLDLLALLKRVRALITDSGGLQEEAAALGTPVLVLRNETEWPYLVEAGKSALIGNEEHALAERALELLAEERNARMRAAPVHLDAFVEEGAGGRGRGAAGRVAGEVASRLSPRS